MRLHSCRLEISAAATSVTLSGSYKDDADGGVELWYTGEGGRSTDGKFQIRDQELTNGNLALMCNFETGVPVRVFRRDGIVFSYEGIYKVTDFQLKDSHDGPKVYLFLLHGIPGESLAVPTTKVLYKLPLNDLGRCSSGGGWAPSQPSQARRPRMRRAAVGRGGVVDRAVKRAKTGEAKRGAAAAVGRRQALLAAIRPRPKLLCEDLSYGKENVPIPVFNEVNDSRELPQLEYQSDYVWAEGVQEMVRPILEEAEHQSRQFFGEGYRCGMAVNRGMHSRDIEMERAGRKPKNAEYVRTDLSSYSRSNHLLATNYNGLVECSSSCCRAGVDPKQMIACKRHMQVSNGVTLPLEVFMTAQKGWGMRCAVAVPAGAFILAYIGELNTEHQAELNNFGNHYQYNLDHFMATHQLMVKEGMVKTAEAEALHRIPPMMSTHAIFQAMRQHAASVQTTSSAAPQASHSACSSASPSRSDGACEARPDLGSTLDTPAHLVSDLDDDMGCDDRRGGVSALSPAAISQGHRQRAEHAETFGKRQATPPSPHPPPTAKLPVTVSSGSSGGSRPSARLATLPRVRAPLLAGHASSARGQAVAAAAAAAAAGGGDESPRSRAAAALGLPTCPHSGDGWCVQAGDGPEYESLLVIDAQRRGNAARFINGKCGGGNLIPQTVFMREARNTLYHYVAFFAAQDIPANVELDYDYKWNRVQGKGEAVRTCFCGSAVCAGAVL
ncbi:MAG: hypothetical protein WDW38_006884 [Sanguina aurantia]